MGKIESKVIFVILLFVVLQAKASVFTDYALAAQHDQLYCPDNLTQFEKNKVKAEFLYAEQFPIAHCKYSLPLSVRFKLWLGLKKAQYKARSGNKEAAFNVSMAYRKGIGVKASNEKYIDWSIKAAKWGSYAAQKEVFSIYQSQKRSLTMSQLHYVKANMPHFMNHICAQNKGECYLIKFMSAKISGDKARAFDYLKKSVKNGNSESYLFMVIHYLRQKNENIVKARHYIDMSLQVKISSIYLKKFAYEFLVDIEQLKKNTNQQLIQEYIEKMNYYQQLTGYPFVRFRKK